MQDEATQAVDQVIRARRTLKMLASEPLGQNLNRAEVDAIIAAAGYAPFHKPSAKEHRDTLTSFQPWRCHALDHKACCELRERLIDAGDTTKLPAMLAAARALIQITWLPNPPKERTGQLFDPTLENMEHLAAASAAAQNILLAATARGIENYWSSGGALRDPDVFELLGISRQEILLGAIFLFPSEADAPTAETKPGKLHDKRGPQDSWARWVKLL